MRTPQNRRSLTLRFDALGAPVVERTTARTFDGETGDFSFGQFLMALAATHFLLHLLQNLFIFGSLDSPVRVAWSSALLRSLPLRSGGVVGVLSTFGIASPLPA
jgi:hypothetical protein